MSPLDGHDFGGRGSTNSGGSVSSSEYSLTRSSATFIQGKFNQIDGRQNLHTIDCSRLTNRRTYYESINISKTNREYNATINNICKSDQMAIRCHTNATRTSRVTVVAKTRIKPARAASIVGVVIVTKAVKPTIVADNRLKRTESHLLTV